MQDEKVCYILKEDRSRLRENYKMLGVYLSKSDALEKLCEFKRKMYEKYSIYSDNEAYLANCKDMINGMYKLYAYNIGEEATEDNIIKVNTSMTDL